MPTLAQTGQRVAFLTDKNELKELYQQADQESRLWREDYHEFERLADNGLLPDLDENLPEVNDGSLAASLYKLPKRIVNSQLTGRFKSDRDEAWVAELANIIWENEIIPNANSQAPFHRKWKDAVRKAAIYGSIPLITLFVERGDYTGADFIVGQPQDVKLEPGKASDYDSDLMFWEIYMSKLQLENLIERAKKETKEAKESEEDSYNKWDIQALEDILASNVQSDRQSDEDYKQKQDEGVKTTGFKFCIVVQRGINAPFYMYHKDTNKTVRQWSNQDPTGDITIHFLYCYQDFINPYGTGIVKLAGGTQNVLDHYTQIDVLATQLGVRPPMKIAGNADDVDIDSLVYQRDALWFVGGAQVERQEISNQVYQGLPERISMQKIRLNQMIPTGDTSISSGAGDTDYSKTPAGVKFQQANLSIDDEDFKDNLYITYEAVAKSMVNIHFANNEGSQLIKLTDDERERLIKAGLEWPIDPITGELVETNELEVVWEEARAKFDFKMDVDQDKAKDEQQRLEAELKVLELTQSVDPALLDQELAQSGKKLNRGELLADIISLTSDNDKIIVDISPQDEQAMQEQQVAQEQLPQGQQEQQVSDTDQEAINIQAIMEEYGVNQEVAEAMRAAEQQGYTPEEIQQVLQARQVANVR